MPSEAYSAWEKSARVAWHGPAPAQLAVPLNLRATFYREKRVGDIGNYLAALCDLLETRGVVVNDKHIVSFDGSRLAHDKANPRIEFVLEDA